MEKKEKGRNRRSKEKGERKYKRRNKRNEKRKGKGKRTKAKGNTVALALSRLSAHMTFLVKLVPVSQSCTKAKVPLVLKGANLTSS